MGGWNLIHVDTPPHAMLGPPSCAPFLYGEDETQPILRPRV